MLRKSTSMLLKLEQIEVGKRFRADYGDLDELILSIKEHGELLQPIVVKRTAAPDHYQLLAGGRRFAAHEKAGMAEVKAEVWPEDLTELECRKIELAENIKRKNLTWQEEIELTAEIDRLLKAEGGGEATQEAVAELVGKDRTVVTRDLQLSKDMLVVPELKNAKTKKDAMAKAIALRERIVKSEIARRLTDKRSVDRMDAVKKQLTSSYILKDCLEYMPTIEEGSYDLVEFDPPYGISIDTVHGDKASGGEGYKDFSEIEKYDEFVKAVVAESHRILKETGWIIVWCSVIHLGRTADILEQAGFRTNRIPIIWHKLGAAVANNNCPDISLNTNYEVALYARRSAKSLLNLRGANAILQAKPVSGKLRIHKAEKPTSIEGILLTIFVGPGASVYVPCAGSGNTLFVGIANKSLKVIGTDIEENSLNAYLARVAMWNPDSVVMPDQEKEEVLSNGDSIS